MRDIINTQWFRRITLLLPMMIVGGWLVLGQSIATTNRTDSIIYLTLDSCRSRALRSNTDLQVARLTLEKAQAEKSAVLSKYFPNISVMGGATYLFQDQLFLESIDKYLPPFVVQQNDMPPIMTAMMNQVLEMIRAEIVNAWKPIEVSLKGTFLASVTLQQPIFTGGRIIAGNKMAKTGEVMAAENIILKEAEALNEADQIYWMYVSVREKVKLAELYTKLLEEVLTTVTHVEDVEMINLNDLLKVKVQYNQVKAELQKAKSGLELTRMALCKTIGVGYDTHIIPTDTVVQTDTIYPLLPEHAVENRSEYRLLQQMIRLKEGEIQLVRGNYLPTLGLGASLTYLGGVKIQGGYEPPYNLSNITATLSIPITNWWEGSKKIKSAKVDRTIAELELEKNRKLMELEIKQATFNMVDAFNRITMAQEGLDQAQENLRVSRDRYEVELETITNLLQAQAQWQTVYSNLIDARIDFRIAESAFLKATGQLTPERLNIYTEQTKK